MQDCGTILIVDSDDSSRLTAGQVAVRLGFGARPSPDADVQLTVSSWTSASTRSVVRKSWLSGWPPDVRVPTSRTP